MGTEMKVKCLALTILADTGISTIRIYPEVITRKKMEQIAFESISKESEEGSFKTGAINNHSFGSYVFLIRLNEQNILASLTAIYKGEDIDWEKARNALSETVKEYREKDKYDLALFAEELPDIYEELQPIYMKFQSSSTYSVSVEPIKKPKPEKDIYESLKEDFWNDGVFDDDEDEKEESEDSDEFHDIPIDE
ncbi:MAG: hypothetical protein ACFFDW_13115 [Candidatus Thorarchaeota archaeon]